MAAGEVVTLGVTTESPLLRRGLVRAATGAGFTVVPDRVTAQVLLHMGPMAAWAQEREPDVDIAVEAGCIVVTVRRAPSWPAMARLHSLLGSLVEGGGPLRNGP